MFFQDDEITVLIPIEGEEGRYMVSSFLSDVSPL